MKLFSMRGFPWERVFWGIYFVSVVLSAGVDTSPADKAISPHAFANELRPAAETSLLKGRRIMEMDAPHSFVQAAEKDIWVGLIDLEYIMQSSHTLVLAFKKASKYIYSSGFVRQLYSSNPWLRYSISSLEQKLNMVKKLEKISHGWKLTYWNKPHSAAELLTKQFLHRVFSLRKRFVGEERRKYQTHFKRLNEALLQNKAGTKALELILASKTLPMYSWTESFYNNPFATVQNTIIQAFEDAVGGVSGLFSSEAKNSCFSFAYRVNAVAPYTTVYPGGILGDIMKGLVRSYFLVFQQSLVNFKGVFALLIGIICKTQIVQAAANSVKPFLRLARRGLRAVRAFWAKTIAMSGDPVGRGVMDRMLRREAVVLITILFQLHAVNVEKQYEEADSVSSALPGPGGSWSLAEGLFIGASEFGRAFFKLIEKYRRSAEAYVLVCEKLKGGLPLDVEVAKDEEETEREKNVFSQLNITREGLDAALEFFPEAHPEASGSDEPLSLRQKLKLLHKSCKRNKTFVHSYNAKPLYYAHRVIREAVRLLRYYFKYFKSYISDVLSIFYETSLSMLETKLNEATAQAEGVSSPAEEIAPAEAHYAAKRAAAQQALEEGQLPRKLFRANKFKEESEKLANGFFEAAGGFSLFKLAAHAPDGPYKSSATEAALRLLTDSEGSTRKGLGTIYQRFLNSQILLARVEKNQQRIKVFELLAKCHAPLEEKTEEEKELCGSIVTSEIDEVGFIANGLFATNLAISGPQDDIAFFSTGQATAAFEAWAEYAKAKRKEHAAKIASLNADAETTVSLIRHLREAALEKLTFRRFERSAEHSDKLILYDEGGRSLTFTGDNAADVENLFTPQRGEDGRRVPKPDPLDCTSRFNVRDGNHGELEFFLEAGQRRNEAHQQHIPAEPVERVFTPAISIEGRLEYNDERRELTEIQNDPNAIRDTIAASFVEERGRVAAEAIAGILMLLHGRLPIFWKRSPVELLQHITPKMFFDALYILSTQAYDRSEATVMLDGKLYTFPKSFTAIKDIILSAVNRAITRMHSLNASDAALLIAMSTVHFAYKKIQKHRTGRTAAMHLFLKEVNHIMNIFTTDPESLKTLHPECAFFTFNWESPQEEDVLKCSLLRFMKLGSLNITEEDLQEEAWSYLDAFVTKLAELKGAEPWRSYLNLNYFLKAAKMYGKTAAKYRYETLYNQLNDIPGTAEEESELANLMKKMHPSLSGHRPPRPKKQKGFIAMLRKLREKLPTLPKVIREKLTVMIKNCYARLRRFFGSRRSWFYGWKISPKVIQGPHFMAAIKYAEQNTYPDLDKPGQLFIEVADIEEFGKMLVTLEGIAATLDSPNSMYNTVTQFRSTPAFTAVSRERHQKLITRAKTLGSDVVKVAAGWVLKTAPGASGVNMALGLLALLDPSGRFMDKALQLRYLSAEVLAFLESSLDLAYLLQHIPSQSQEEVTRMRFRLNQEDHGSFTVKAQCEPKGLGVNIADPIDVVAAVTRLESLLQKQQGFSESGVTTVEHCQSVTKATLRKKFDAGVSIPHEALLSASESFGLCFLLLRLREKLAGGETTVTMEAFLQSVIVDKQPLLAHLDFLQQRSANVDDRKLRAKYIGPILRHVLMAAIDNLGEKLGGISFRSYDGEAKLLSFQYTLEETSPRGPPGKTLAYAAELLLGADSEKQHRFVAFSIEGPQFLMDWYKYVLPDKLQELVDKAREGKAQITYEAMRKLSNVYRVTDLSDLAYSIRQRSKLEAGKVAKAAALKLMESGIEPALRRYGLALMLTDVFSHSDYVKQQCIKKMLEEYENYSASTLLDKELFKYDCFYTEICTTHAFADAAKGATEQDVEQVVEAVDAAYEAETQRLYEKLLQSGIPHSTVASIAFKAHEWFAMTPLLEIILPKFLHWTRQKTPWAQVAAVLKTERLSEWAVTNRTSTLGRVVTHLEHPYLLNPYQTLTDLILATITGSPRRRRFPVLAPVKRLKAIYAAIKPGKKSRAEAEEDRKDRQNDAELELKEYTEAMKEATPEDEGPPKEPGEGSAPAEDETNAQ